MLWKCCCLALPQHQCARGGGKGCWTPREKKIKKENKNKINHKTSGQNTQTIKVGDVVLIHDDTPRIIWKLAVIEELLKGKDGLVRAANIRTALGRTNRPIARLIPLEVSSETTELNTTSSDLSSNTSVKPAEGIDQPNNVSEGPKRGASLRGRERE